MSDTDLDRLPFDKRGFDALKTEIIVLAELVTAMADVLTPQQKDAVRTAQKDKTMSQEDFETSARTATEDSHQHLANERLIRIKRTLA